MGNTILYFFKAKEIVCFLIVIVFACSFSYQKVFGQDLTQGNRFSKGHIEGIINNNDVKKATTTQNKGAIGVTLSYAVKPSIKVEWLYSEVVVPKQNVPEGTYFSVLCSPVFYTGIQKKSLHESLVIFSVWDIDDGNNRKSKVPKDKRASLVFKDNEVVSNRFGSEGSGIHTHLDYLWKEDTVYKFLVHIQVDSINSRSVYSMFFFQNDKWRLIAKISRPKFDDNLGGLCSFVEDWTRKGRQNVRAAYFQNQWVRDRNQAWTFINNAAFYAGNKADSITASKDYGSAVVENNGFVLITGGGIIDFYLPNGTYLKQDKKMNPPLEKMPE